MIKEEVGCITHVKFRIEFAYDCVQTDLYGKFQRQIFLIQCLTFYPRGDLPITECSKTVLGLAWKFIKPQNMTLTQTANCFAHKQGLLLQEQEFWQFYQVPIKNQSNQTQSRNLHIVDFTLVTVKNDHLTLKHYCHTRLAIASLEVAILISPHLAHLTDPNQHNSQKPEGTSHCSAV